MRTLTVGFSRLTIAACATVITAVSAAGFMHATASAERDPFNFGAVMAANAQLRTEQLLSSNTASTCSDSVVGGRARMCWG